MNHDIFISYSSKQKSIADGVCHYLEENGFKCWMAPRDILVGSDYGDLIEDAIKTCKVVVLVFSQSASISKWVKGEINVAFTEDKPILPFRVDETEIKGGFRVMLNQMHWIDAFPQYADRLPDLLNSVCGFLGRQTRKLNIQGSTTREIVGDSQKHIGTATNLFNGHEYVNLGLPSGTLWATCNVGANKPEDYGDYFAWGETRPKIEYSWNTYKYGKVKKHFLKEEDDLLTKYCDQSMYGYEGFTDEIRDLQPVDDAAMVNWGKGWVIPSLVQWNELLKNTSNKWTKQNGVEGRIFTSKKNGGELFLPAAGGRWGSKLKNAGSYGYYWSRSYDASGFSCLAWNIYFTSGCDLWTSRRDSGFSVRPVRGN